MMRLIYIILQCSVKFTIHMKRSRELSVKTVIRMRQGWKNEQALRLEKCPADENSTVNLFFLFLSAYAAFREVRVQRNLSPLI